ncbi:DUF1553 domain-containing protein [Planctomicrobium piriforme]|uniref:DUF1549 domain-containing protein n=1 Tax=Planctomicrobium piriforme TaxID=1576369 RepID=A0A1I3AZ55_9PLAN|nr:DUF1553 domain-containing protein [Planctomicrobium piriforme]SFH55365.1 Protein of unknown function [Planctomicrobium piriforme]
MTSGERRDLLQRVDALCEGTATAADLARLEELVLRDAEARRLYVEAIELHGQLYWDAAGAGAAETLPKPLQASASSKRPVNRRSRQFAIAAGSLAAILLIVASAVWTFPPAPQHDKNVLPNRLANQAHPQAAETVPPVLSSAPAKVPEITLPTVPAMKGEVELPLAVRPQSTLAIAAPPRTDAGLVQLVNAGILRNQTEHGVTPAPQANDAEWVRRVYLDLAGRIPTPAEVESFFQEGRPEKRALLVDSLLASPAFARHQATVWTNLLVGRTRDEAIRRDTMLSWLNRQFAENRPWRETVGELVAAEGTQENGPANFLLAHLNNQAVPATAITSRILLCEQLQCAQCHQHPVVKEWEQSRFWELNAFFQQTKIQETMALNPSTKRMEPVRELVDLDRFGPTYYESLRGVMQVAYPRYAGVEVMTEQPSPLREQLSKLLFAEDRPQPARAFVNRTWAQFFGYGFTSPVDDMGPQTPVSHPELLEQLTAAFVASDYDVKRLVRWICLSDAYQRSSQPAATTGDTPELGDPALFSRMYVKPLTAEQLYDSLLVAAGTAPDELLLAASENRRETWLAQFYTSVDTEENSESSTFDGSLPQALMMINGDLVQNATSPGKSRILDDVTSRGGVAEADRIRQLCLAALSRYPSQEELAQVRDVLRRSIRQRTERNVPLQLALAEGLKDVYWAYLNSSEFAVNH